MRALTSSPCTSMSSDDPRRSSTCSLPPSLRLSHDTSTPIPGHFRRTYRGVVSMWHHLRDVEVADLDGTVRRQEAVGWLQV